MPVASDDFNRANETPLAGWLSHTSTLAWGVRTNEAGPNSTAGCVTLHNTAAGTDTIFAQATFRTSAASTFHGLALRGPATLGTSLTNTGTVHSLLVSGALSDTLAIRRKSANSATQTVLTSTTRILVAGDVLRFESDPNGDLRAYVNGIIVPELSTNDTTSLGQRRSGFFSTATGVTAARWDDFSGGDRSTSTNLVVADAVHAHIADNVALVQQHGLAVDDAAHGHVADAPSLTQAHALAVADALHAHTADALTFSQVHVLTVNAALHGHAADTVALSQPHQLVIDNGAHAHTAEDVTLASASGLVVADASHAHTADALAITVSSTLVVFDVEHAHTPEALALEQLHQLVVADAFHDHVAEVLVLVGQASWREFSGLPAVHSLDEGISAVRSVDEGVPALVGSHFEGVPG